MSDMLSFTKSVTEKSGIDLVTYIINYIDQNTIAYGLLNQLQQSVDCDTNVDGDSIIIKYDLTRIEDRSVIQRINNLFYFIQDNPVMKIGESCYNIASNYTGDDQFTISINSSK